MFRKTFFTGLWLCLLAGIGSNLFAQTEDIHRAWATVFGKADTTDDFLIYDATIPDFDTTRIYIVGLARNGNAFPVKAEPGNFFYAKDSSTDAFLACFSTYGNLLWSTWLPPAQDGYINGFASCVRSVFDSNIIVVCNDYDYRSADMPLEDFRKTIPIAQGQLHLLEFHKDGRFLREKAFTTRPSIIPPRIFDIIVQDIYTEAYSLPLKLAGHHLFTKSLPASFSISDGCLYSLSLPWSEDTLTTPQFRSDDAGSSVYSSAYYIRRAVLVNYIHFSSSYDFANSEPVGKGKLNVGYYDGSLFNLGMDAQITLSLAPRYDLFPDFVEEWDVHNEDTGGGFQYYASPSSSNGFFTGTSHTIGLSLFSGTVQNTKKLNNRYIVQGIHCKDYQNGFFRKGNELYAYSHNETDVLADYGERNPDYTTVPFLYLYDESFEGTSILYPDSLHLVGSTFLDMDWYFEDFFFRTDLSRPQNLFMPYDPVLLTSGNRFFMIGNVRKIGEKILTSGESDPDAHHQGIILSFSIGCPPDTTSFQNVEFLCPGDSAELKVTPDYSGFKFRFDASLLENGSIVLNADSTQAWAKQAGLFAATLDGSALGCPDVAVDTVQISPSPYPEPISSLNPDSTIAVCAAASVLLNPVTEHDSTFSYLWFDGDTAATKILGFDGDSIFFASVEVKGYCSSFTDSAQIRFLPPYVNLGKDTTLCVTHLQMFTDSSVLLQLNARQDYYPDADWIFRWKINGREASDSDSLLLHFSDLEESGINTKSAFITIAVSLSDTTNSCTAHDTLVFSLISLPDDSDNIFLPESEILCAHQDLELVLPDTADLYHCFWLDKDSVQLPYGADTNRFTISGMHGTDGFGANTDTREPRFFQLRLDHKLCGVSFFDTLLVYDQVKPAFELPFHDTVICLNEAIELDSLNPFVYRPFYEFVWDDGTKGSAYTLADSGSYRLFFFVREEFAVCGYDTAFDTVHTFWSDPALTLISLPADTAFCERLSITLDASVPYPSTRYSWQEGILEDLFSPLDDSTLFTSPIITVDKDVSYGLFVVDTMGCVNIQQVNIREEDCKPQLSIPNVFTPNGDGVNDVLKFKQIEKCYDVDILIVDRKGYQVLHEKVRNPDDFSWNGCYKNGSRKLPDGAYFYLVSYKDAYGKKKVQSGSITILGSTE